MITVEFDEVQLKEIIREVIREEITSERIEEKKWEKENRYLYSLKELADFMHCSLKTAQRLKNNGLIPYKQIGRKVSYDKREILKAMEPNGLVKKQKNNN